MAMMSIQAFYYSLRGPQSLFGLTFGAYDLGALLSLLSSLLLLLFKVTCLYADSRIPNRSLTLSLSLVHSLGALITAPILGYLSDRFHVFKILFATCLVINAMGNLIYAFTFLGDAWYMMLIARLVAGVGAGALGLGTSYCSQTTTVDQRQRRLVTYRTSQSVARMVGPFIGYIFLGLPQVNSSSSTALKVFNWYVLKTCTRSGRLCNQHHSLILSFSLTLTLTRALLIALARYTIPGWVAFFVVAALSGLFWWMFVDPTVENEHVVRRAEQAGEATPQRRREFYTFCGIWMVLVFFATLLQFGYYSNLFAVFAGQYHAINDQYDQWKVFLGIAGGACAASVIYRVGVKVLPRIFDERYVTMATSWLFMGAVLLVIPYGGATSVPKEATFYASTVRICICICIFARVCVVIREFEGFRSIRAGALVHSDPLSRLTHAHSLCASFFRQAMFGLGVVMFGPSVEIVLSKKITQYQDVVGDNIAKILGLFYMAHASGRFAGPLILAAVTFIATPSGQTYYCANGYDTDDAGNPICIAPTETSCAIFPDVYYVEGCVLKNSLPVYAVWAGVAGLLSTAYMVTIWKWWSYDVDVVVGGEEREERKVD